MNSHSSSKLNVLQAQAEESVLNLINQCGVGGFRTPVVVGDTRCTLHVELVCPESQRSSSFNVRDQVIEGEFSEITNDEHKFIRILKAVVKKLFVD